MTAISTKTGPPRCAGCNKVLEADELEYYGATCDDCERKSLEEMESEHYSSAAAPMAGSIALPFITDGLWAKFNDTCLMSWDVGNNRPDWTQTAVDFVTVLQIKGKQ